MLLVILLLVVGTAQAETIRNVYGVELPDPVMLGRYDEANQAEVLVAAIPRNGGLELWVIVQSKQNFSLSWSFPLGAISSLASVEELGDGEYEIVVGLNGEQTSQAIAMDVSDALEDLESALYARDRSPRKSSISVERSAVAVEPSAEASAGTR